jgi:hypothetical protein
MPSLSFKMDDAADATLYRAEQQKVIPYCVRGNGLGLQNSLVLIKKT